MNDTISLIGTIASIGSIPLAFYFFIKSKEEKREKVRREIVKLLLYQLNDTNLVSIFEIQSVINSKCRENRIDSKSIIVTEIIDDLLAEIMSNPLLQKENKMVFIAELMSLYYDIHDAKERAPKAPAKMQSIAQEKIEVDVLNEEKKNTYKGKLNNLSQLFIITAFAMVGLVYFSIHVIEILYQKKITIPLLDTNDFQSSIIIGFITSILSVGISALLIAFKQRHNVK